jgi:hypothetical protein
VSAPTNEQIAEMMREQQQATRALWDQLARTSPTAEMRDFCRTVADRYDTQGGSVPDSTPAPSTGHQPAPSSEG